jgi:nucleoside-diphosphate-sugar epimerase
MTYLLFGGSGYVGKSLQSSSWFNNMIFATDITESNEAYCDVRQPINIDLAPWKPDWIFLLAAIHREPGHEPKEYFETNILGAHNIKNYANRVGCKNIFFMSSISPYGPTPGPTDESALPQPNSPYGTSKLAAELILQGWQKESSDRRLIICRPGVIFGPNDPGNIGRTIHAVRKGYFFYPGDRRIRKSYAYMEGLLESMAFTMDRSEPLILYNYVEQETETLENLCKVIAEEYKCRPPLFSIPLPILMPMAHLAQKITAGHSPLHPIRVRKAAMPTHIIPKWLIDNGFSFRWDFRTALRHIKTQEVPRV